MEDTQKIKNEDYQDPKNANMMQQAVQIDRPDKTMVFGDGKYEGNAIEPLFPLNKVAFKYRRFVGTAKHKTEMFYKFKFLVQMKNVCNNINHARCFVTNYKKQFTIATSMILVLVSGIIIYDMNVGYKVTFNGEEVGIVENQEIFTEAVQVVNDELSARYDSEIVFDQDIKFEKTIIDKDKLLKDVEQNVQAVYDTNIDLAVNGVVLVIDGEEVASLTSKEEAEEVLEGVLKPYTRLNKKSKLLEEPKIKEDYAIIEKQIDFSSVMEVEEVIDLISQGTDEIKEYKVKDGDTSWDIAVNRGVNIGDLEKANPDKDITKLHDGDVIKLTAHEPYLTVETKVEEITEEKTKYDTVYKDDSSLYIGKTKVITEGQMGTVQIISEVSYVNGEEIEREVTNEKIIKQPKDQIVAKGTKALPPGKGTGQFRLPTNGRISVINKAGSHSGGKAVDIANSIGTRIYAADTGTVTHASNSGNGYGNYIVINHGNGYSTLYAHLSSYKVSVGDRVSRGQYIAGMGSTGNSTGSHLHFEVQKNGVRQVITNYFAGLAKGRYVSP